MGNLCRVLILIVVLAGCSSGGSDSVSTPTPSPTPDAASLCNASTGLREPLPACSTETPCTRVAAEVGTPIIDSPEVAPQCDSSVWDERLTQDVLGFTRHACIHRPPGAAASSKRPLILWFHPGGTGGADLAATETHLPAKADSFDLTDDPARPGFILVAVQGRNLRFPTAEYRDGLHHDFYYRDIEAPSTNPDIVNADAVIDAMVAEGIVDTDRIYVMGWSNGGFFAQLYAFARHAAATPGGYKVAAAAVFATANPFGNIGWDPFDEVAYSGTPSCAVPVPSSTLPVYIVYRTADAAVACDAVQAECFGTEPGYITSQWLDTAAAAGLAVSGQMIGGLESGSAVGLDENAAPAQCTDYSAGCPTGYQAVYCLVNHERWPDGAYNNPPDGYDRESDMLDFLKDNPL